MIEHNKKQLRFHHEHLTTSHCRSEFMHECNEENKRVNVDSAKKKACLQHMDYDNFRQMVLGANLMPTKPGALEIYKTTQQMEFNHAAAINSIQHLTAVQVEGQGYNEEIVRETLALTQSDQL